MKLKRFVITRYDLDTGAHMCYNIQVLQEVVYETFPIVARAAMVFAALYYQCIL